MLYLIYSIHNFCKLYQYCIIVYIVAYVSNSAPGDVWGDMRKEAEWRHGGIAFVYYVAHCIVMMLYCIFPSALWGSFGFVQSNVGSVGNVDVCFRYQVQRNIHDSMGNKGHSGGLIHYANLSGFSRLLRSLAHGTTSTRAAHFSICVLKVVVSNNANSFIFKRHVQQFSVWIDQVISFAARIFLY